MTTENQPQSPLNDAPKSVQLAVDLIQLLEENNIDTQTAIEALQITLNDFKRKQQSE
ncbi:MULTISPECIES: YbaM family protein [Shewanella]|uniref:YbaM family protein n=1 Tax=Shewanella electrodiphila TaxID=934143 RepID=A0ABT0KQA8_9GAMM|nr:MULTISPECIES: YbaM family protein [Shewanella]MCC4834338.1 YbaM family protein [Shewanella sp. 10N.7]MCL1045545.1 YbaM family protein [Shewanella electrodiphila]